MSFRTAGSKPGSKGLLRIDSGGPIRCKGHGQICVVKTRTAAFGPNQNRKFYACPMPPGQQCSFFKWVDAARMESRSEGFKNRALAGGASDRFFRSPPGTKHFHVRNDPLNGEHHDARGFKRKKPEGRREGSESTKAANQEPPLCDCAESKPCVIRTVRKPGPNTGRQFWTCSLPWSGPRCRVFHWADEGPPPPEVSKRENQSVHEVQNAQSPDEPSSQFVKRFRSSAPIDFQLNSLETLSLELPLSVSQELLQALKDIPGAEVTKTGPAASGTLFGITKAVIPLTSHGALIRALKAHDVKYNDLHPPLLTAIVRYSKKMQRRLEKGIGLKASKEVDPEAVKLLLGKRLANRMMPFQKEGVEFAVQRGGRCLIGDDMGLGKTIQAIGIARIYRDDWPLLIVCPSSVRLNWKEELLRWLGKAPSSPCMTSKYSSDNEYESEADVVSEDEVDFYDSLPLKERDINVIFNGKDCLRGMSPVNIVSYDLVRKIDSRELERCGVIIADESHYLKSTQAMRTKFVTKLIRTFPRALLLSGTPALSRPVELFPQVSALEPELYPSFHAYVARYCNARQTRFGWDYSGASNLNELHLILRGSCLIRRKKADVLSQLPPKTRHMVYVETNAKTMKEVSRQFNELQKAKAASDLAKTNDAKLRATNAIRAIQTKLYLLSAEAKLDAMLDYLKETAEVTSKFIVFAHHLTILDAVECYLTKKLKIGMVRIDGSTSLPKRQELCKNFQTNDRCRVAVLSITAAGEGLNFTAATVVLFAELYWNPGSLLQAEDRAHRIGQQDSVFIKYMMGKNTMDDRLWSLIKRKMTVVGKSLTGTAMEMNEKKQPAPGGIGPMNRFLQRARSKHDKSVFRVGEVNEGADAAGRGVVDRDPIQVDSDGDSPDISVELIKVRSTEKSNLTNRREHTNNSQTANKAEDKKVEVTEESEGIDMNEMFPKIEDELNMENYKDRESQDLDEDLALARKLQEQFDAEYSEFLRLGGGS